MRTKKQPAPVEVQMPMEYVVVLSEQEAAIVLEYLQCPALVPRGIRMNDETRTLYDLITFLSDGRN